MQDRPTPRPPVARLAVGIVVSALGVTLLLLGVRAALTQSLPAADGAISASPVGAVTLPPASPGPTGTPAAPSATSGGASPSPSADPVLVGAGDIARCDGTDDEATATLLQQTPGLVFTLGDNAYESGTAQEFSDCYGPSWGRVLGRTAFAVAGNHDYGTRDAAAFKAYFGAAAAPDGVTWFSRDVGTWHVIALDADCGQVDGCGPDSPEGRWLQADLAASTARCTLALWHQPRFSSGVHGNDTSVAPFWDALHAAGADLVLNGHDHDYERFAPQDPSGRADPGRGITEVVVGTGGAPLRDFGPDAANAVVRSSLAHGVLELTLHPTGWSFRFISTDGSFSDQGRGACH